jgi:hypothetical protein
MLDEVETPPRTEDAPLEPRLITVSFPFRTSHEGNYERADDLVTVDALRPGRCRTMRPVRYVPARELGRSDRACEFGR